MLNLTCPRCQQLYSVKFYEHTGPPRHPLLLRCGHTFCAACIPKLQQKEESVNCPTCQASTKVGAEMYKSVYPDKFAVGCMWTKRWDLEIQSQKISGRPNMKVKKKENRRQEAGAGDDGVPCSECLVNTAVCQCLQCEGIMCKPCFDKIHQRSHTLQKHKAVGLTAATFANKQGSLRLIMPSKKTHQRNCPTHDQCQIEYYCEDDQQPICSRCVIMGDHKGHNVQTMEDKNKALLAEMEPAVVDTQETLWRLEKAEKVVRESMPAAKVDTDMMDEVRQHFMALHSQLQAREEQLLDEIRSVSHNATKSFQEMKSYLENEKVKLEETLMDAARAKHGSLHRLVDADLILERLKRAKDLPCVITIKKDAVTAPIRFSHDGSMKDSIQQYGNVSFADTSQMISLNVAGPDAEKPPAEELRSYSVADVDTESLSTADSTSVSGSVAVEEEKNDSDSVDDQVASAEVMDAMAVSFPPMKRLIAGNNEQVNVTHILTPAHFYVQLAKQQVDIGNLHQQINVHCRNAKGRNNWPNDLETGSVVLAQYNVDKKWYRARITDVIKPDPTVSYANATFKVFFIDYGNNAVLSRKKMRKMEKQFTDHSVFAHECALYDILPADEKVGWTRQSADTMLQMTQSGPLLMVVVKDTGDQLEVDLGSSDRQGLGVDECPVSVRDSLVFLGMAIFNTRGPHQGAVVSMRKREYLTLQQADQDVILNIGINCTHSPSLFYAQLKDITAEVDRCVSALQPYTEDSHGHLQRLLIAMQEVYSQETKHLYKVYCPKMGMMCVARYARDNNWYRARVTSIPGPRKVEVQFVDYGNKELVDIADICKILDDHIKYPMQALEATLADVEPVEGGQWSEEAKVWFRSMAELQLCQFLVTERSEKPNSLIGVLYVINCQTNRLCCVNYEMVMLGLAKSTGPWSHEECFSGITLNQEMLGVIAKSPSSSSSPTSPLSGSYRIGSPPLHTSLPQPPASRNNGAAWGKTKKAKAARTRGKPGRSSPVPVLAQNQSASAVAAKNSATATVVVPPQVVMVKREVELDVGESTELEKGAAEGNVCAYSSPSHFYIQLEEKDDELLKLMVDMKVYERAHQSNRQWKVGEFCAAKRGHDQRWYRGKILEESEETGRFSVKLVDFGQVVEIPCRNLKPLRRIHTKQECFAERCHIADLMPTGTTDRNKWSSTATEYVSKLIGPDNVYVKLKGDRVPELGLPVDLFIEDSIEPTALDPGMVKYVSVAAKLEDRGLAIPIKKEKTPQPVEGAPKKTVDMFSTRPMPTLLRSSEEDGEEERGEDEDAGDAITSTIIQPDLQVAPHPPPPSTRVHVMPVHVDSEGIIYAQDFSEGEAVQDLLETLQEHCEKEAPTGVLEVKEGQVCVAFCNDYRYWLRARVLSVSPKHVQVKYIDYGNNDKVLRTQLKVITPELCAKHQLVYELRMDGVGPASEGNAEDKSLLEEYIERLSLDFINKDCTALVQGNLKEHPLLVDLDDYKKDDNADSDSNSAKSSTDSMDVFYKRSNDIADILELPNPYPQLKLGIKGEVFHAMITHLELPNVVFLQRCENPVDNRLPQDLQDFSKLMGDLNSLPRQTPIFTELPPVGSVCSARYGQDQRWYRGLVAKVSPKENQVLVLYVDYGNSEIVPLGDRLRVLPQRFQDTPAQSVRAYLNLTLPEGVDRWARTTYHAMIVAIFDDKHRVLIKETAPLTVELYNRVEGTSLSYAWLVQKGLVAVPQANESPRIEVLDEESSTEEEGSVNSDVD